MAYQYTTNADAQQESENGSAGQQQQQQHTQHSTQHTHPPTAYDAHEISAMTTQQQRATFVLDSASSAGAGAGAGFVLDDATSHSESLRVGGGMAGALHPQQARVTTPSRSIPIAIARPRSSNSRTANGNGNNGVNNNNNNTNNDDAHSSSDDDAGNNMEERICDRSDLDSMARSYTGNRNGNKATQHHQSLPSHLLLRAPLLGSIPTNNEYLFPPPMRLSDQEQPDDDDDDDNREDDDAVLGLDNSTKVSYGSLRDSQLQGRFLDGPGSYCRDKRTGTLRQQQNVRFQTNTNNTKNTMASSAPVRSGLSIGERMQQQRQLQQHLKKKKNSDNNKNNTLANIIGGGVAEENNSSTTAAQKEPTSSLSAMLEASSLSTETPSGRNTATTNNTNNTQSWCAAAENHNNLEEDTATTTNMSTSLTGFEVLQRGLRQQQEQQQQDIASSSRMGSSFTAASFASKTNAAQSTLTLSRSFSDPFVARQQQQQQQAGSVDTISSTDSLLYNANGTAAPATTAGGRDAGFLLPPARTNDGVADGTPTAAAATSTSLYASYILSAAAAAPTIGTNSNVAQHFQQLRNPYPMAVDDDDDDDDDDHNPDTEGAFDLDME